MSGLQANHAVLFTAQNGPLAGTYLVVDRNGATGYQPGEELVIRMDGLSGTLTSSDFLSPA